jgi:hypothetical protein
LAITGASRRAFRSGVAAWVLVGVDDALALAGTDGDRDDLGGEPSRVLGGDGAVVGLERQGVLCFAGDAAQPGDVLCGLEHPAGHRVAFATGGDPGAREAVVHGDALAVRAPAEREPVELDLAHRLRSARDHDVRHAGLHLHRGRYDRGETGAAAAVDLEAGDLDGQAGVEGGYAPDRGRFTVWVALSKDHLIDHRGVDV